MRAAPGAASRVRMGAWGHWDGAEVARAWSSSVLMDPDGLRDVLQQNLSSPGCLRESNHHWEILELTSSLGWDGAAGTALHKLLLMRSRLRAQTCPPTPSPVSPLRVNLYFLKS